VLVKTITQSTLASPVDRLAVGYQLKIHLLGISPQISRRGLVRVDTTLAELHHIFQVVMGWENWHLHRFHLWGKDYGLSYAGARGMPMIPGGSTWAFSHGGSTTSSRIPTTLATTGNTRCRWKNYCRRRLCRLLRFV
jgi:hypothetical protein